MTEDRVDAWLGWGYCHRHRMEHLMTGDCPGCAAEAARIGRVATAVGDRRVASGLRRVLIPREPAAGRGGRPGGWKPVSKTPEGAERGGFAPLVERISETGLTLWEGPPVPEAPRPRRWGFWSVVGVSLILVSLAWAACDLARGAGVWWEWVRWGR